MDITAAAEMRRFNCLSNEIEAVYHETAVKFALSDSALLVLYILCESGGGCPLSDIVRLSGISKQTLCSALRKLEADKVIETELLDARRKHVRLTRRGRNLAKKTAGRLIQIENDIFGSWTAEERSAYLSLTQRYLSALREKIEDI